MIYEQNNPNHISFNFIQRSNNERFFNANHYNIQATEKDDDTNAIKFYNAAGAVQDCGAGISIAC